MTQINRDSMKIHEGNEERAQVYAFDAVIPFLFIIIDNSSLNM